MTESPRELAGPDESPGDISVLEGCLHRRERWLSGYETKARLSALTAAQNYLYLHF